ncbi:LacI family DNA-binding transcriptional regulator [Rubellicoccus peritrichatus]|uniref:LacI family DNA-binding transcriptional regulator n=1 Tax=Rubellicoccus peritrichatus TaxID=3080537 RepID=A0AAQ3LBL9_9BACT|nr:LacI family DNA-binding transcriptional regulator [Puniceicoccus sp. CR14]WOO42756.1 LacI family DNA-binding transcriptional regulator [Puniceicoccus sp. CR14]
MKRNKPITKKKIGLKDLSKELGLSTCTISLILNDKMGNAKYRPETIEKVKKTAEKLGYQPNKVARSLACGKTNTIGLCLADITNPFFSEFAYYFERIASKNDYSTFIGNFGEDGETYERTVKMMLERNVDALVFSPIEPLKKSTIDLAKNNCSQLVAFDRSFKRMGIPQVTLDNAACMHELTEIAINQGFRKIGVITGPTRDPSFQQRVEGVLTKVDSVKSKIKVNIVESDSSTPDGGYKAMAKMWQDGSKPQVLFSLANVLTYGAIQYSLDNGIKLGQDIPFAGFDEIPWSELHSPSLTTVCQPIQEMAEAAFQLAIQTGSFANRKNVKFSPVIRWRDSFSAKT